MPASRKLGAEDARSILEGAQRLIAAKGRKAAEFDLDGGVTEEAVAAMLGPIGNLRAPTARAGKTVLVGFNEDAWRAALG